MVIIISGKKSVRKDKESNHIHPGYEDDMVGLFVIRIRNVDNSLYV